MNGKLLLFLKVLLLAAAIPGCQEKKTPQTAVILPAGDTSETVDEETGEQPEIPPQERRLLISELKALKAAITTGPKDSVFRFFTFPIAVARFQNVIYHKTDPLKNAVSRKWLAKHYEEYFAPKNSTLYSLFKLDLNELELQNRIEKSEVQTDPENPAIKITCTYSVELLPGKVIIGYSTQQGVESYSGWTFSLINGSLHFDKVRIAG